ncbi:M20 family metallo-hydrolase [Rhodovibrionaceae bacterium A322]
MSLNSTAGASYFDRLEKRLETLGAIGATADGGVSRLALTDAEIAGRRQVMAWMEEDGLSVEVDAIGNIFGTLEVGDPSAAPLMIGSHIDSVGNGGKLDGPYGVLSGLEAARALKQSLDKGERVAHRPLVVASFTNEEGVRFQPDMMGSLVMAGGMDLQEALASKDKAGITLGEELARAGFAGVNAPGFLRPHAFIELHIEQGPLLEAEGLSIGVVENLQGIFWTKFILTGQANHAGTTPLNLRHDAGLVAAEITVEARRLAKASPGQLATVGTVDYSPGLINVVPAKATLPLDLRNPDKDALLETQKAIEDYAQERAAAEGLSLEITPLVRFDPVTFDPQLVQLIEQQTKAAGYSHRRMTSGAGHDAQMMARICPSAMIFVPSIKGISHNPAEATAPSDLRQGLDILLRTAFQLCSS